jgi:hypothetical protein
MEWTIVRLVVSENDGAVTTAKWNCREEQLKLRSARGDNQTLCLEKTTLRVRAHIQTVGLNAEKKMIGFEPKGEVFLLTFPLIGPYRFCDKPGP